MCTSRRYTHDAIRTLIAMDFDVAIEMYKNHSVYFDMVLQHHSIGNHNHYYFEGDVYAAASTMNIVLLDSDASYPGSFESTNLHPQFVYVQIARQKVSHVCVLMRMVFSGVFFVDEMVFISVGRSTMISELCSSEKFPIEMCSKTCVFS